MECNRILLYNSLNALTVRINVTEQAGRRNYIKVDLPGTSPLKLMTRVLELLQEIEVVTLFQSPLNSDII